TKSVVVPSDRGAALVKFGVAQDTRNAVVVIKAVDGAVVPVGSLVRVADGGEEAVMGYGGEVYLRGLKPQNTLLVDRAGGSSCRVDFEYRPAPGNRVVIN